MKYPKDLLGKKELKEIFSFDGRTTQPMIIWVLSLIYLCNRLVQEIGASMLAYIAELLLFYPALAAIQKRSRDANMKGTFFVVCYTMCIIRRSVEHIVPISQDIIIGQYTGYVMSFFYTMILLLCVLPSKPEADMSLRSPLLKYPLIYTTICWVICIVATVSVNSLTGAM